jgi:hypothetical protein
LQVCPVTDTVAHDSLTDERLPHKLAVSSPPSAPALCRRMS